MASREACGSEEGKELLKARAEKVERSFAHVLDSGGMRRTTLRGLEKINRLLGTSRLLPIILIGVGNLGTARLSYRRFRDEGFEVVAAVDQEVFRARRDQIVQPVYPMEELLLFVAERDVRLAIVTVPPSSAQEVVDIVIDGGIAGILNFAPMVVEVPEAVAVHNVNLAIELEILNYFTLG